MINYEFAVAEALQKAVIAAVGASIPVKPLNTNFKAPTDGKWWEIVYIPNNRENEFWGEGKTYQGIMRLILHWPQDNKGIYIPGAELSRVANQFVKGASFADSNNLVNVKIQEHPNATGVIEQSPELLLPLTVRYSCFKVS